MDITLLGPTTAEGALVRIAGEGVAGCGEWRGTRPCQAGTVVAVELSVLDDVDWADVRLDPGADLEPDPGTDGWLSIRGVVVELTYDDVLVLSVGRGTVLVDTAGEAPLQVVGRTVVVTVPRAAIYPIDA